MALKLKRKRREIEDIPLSSTADIAFLLIIFFLAVSALMEFRGVRLPLPRADAPPMQILRENIYRLQLPPSGELTIESEVVSLDEMADKVVEALSANSELVVVLEVDPEAPSGAVPEVIQTLQQIGVVRFSMTMREVGR